MGRGLWACWGTFGRWFFQSECLGSRFLLTSWGALCQRITGQPVGVKGELDSTLGGWKSQVLSWTSRWDRRWNRGCSGNHCGLQMAMLGRGEQPRAHTAPSDLGLLPLYGFLSLSLCLSLGSLDG